MYTNPVNCPINHQCHNIKSLYYFILEHEKLTYEHFISLELDIVTMHRRNIVYWVYRILIIISGAVYRAVDHIFSLVILYIHVQRRGYL